MCTHHPSTKFPKSGGLTESKFLEKGDFLQGVAVFT